MLKDSVDQCMPAFADGDWSRPVPSPQVCPSAGLTADLLAGLLDDLDYGMMVLDGWEEILLANHRARMEIESGRLVARRGDRLVAAGAGERGKLSESLAKGFKGIRSLVSLGGGSDRLTLSITPLRAQFTAAPEGDSAAHILVILGKRRICEDITLRMFGRMHGLTGAEQTLLPAIADGLSGRDMAARQRVAESTIKTQVRNICGKTRAGSLRELMVRLISLPPAIGVAVRG